MQKEFNFMSVLDMEGGVIDISGGEESFIQLLQECENKIISVTLGSSKDGSALEFQMTHDEAGRMAMNLLTECAKLLDDMDARKPKIEKFMNEMKDQE